MERNNLIKNLFPDATRKQPSKEESVMAFCADVLGGNTFNPSGKPEAVPGGYIIRGTNKVQVRSKDDKEDEANSLIKAIDKKVEILSVFKEIQ
jgi:hypothetical protein